MLATQELWLTKDFKRVVPAGHEDAYIVAVRKGNPIPGYMYERLDFQAVKAVTEVETRDVKPQMNKAVKPRKNKHGNRLV